MSNKLSYFSLSFFGDGAFLAGVLFFYGDLFGQSALASSCLKVSSTLEGSCIEFKLIEEKAVFL